MIICINEMVAGALTWFGWVSSEQHDRRKQAVSDLSEANRKLEATLRENAGLHEQLLTQAREAGMLGERQRMAREIHDTLAHGAGRDHHAAASRRAGHPVGGGAGRHIEAATRLARDSLAEARRSVQAIAPQPLAMAGLPEALADVAGRWSALHGITAGASPPHQSHQPHQTQNYRGRLSG